MYSSVLVSNQQEQVNSTTKLKTFLHIFLVRNKKALHKGTYDCRLGLRKALLAKGDAPFPQ